MIDISFTPRRFKLLILLISIAGAMQLKGQITCPPNKLVINDSGQCGASVSDLGLTLNLPPTSYDAVTFEISGATMSAGSDDASGQFFEVGSSTLTYQVWLNAMLVDECQSQVTVLDFEAATSNFCANEIRIGEDGILFSDPAGMLLNVEPVDNCGGLLIDLNPLETSDNCEGPVIITLIDSPDLSEPLMPGEYDLVYSIKDNSGNTTSCIFSIVVLNYPSFEIEALPSAIGCEGDLIELQPTSVNLQSGIDWIGPDNYTSDDLKPEIKLDSGSAGLYTLIYESSNGCISQSSIELSLSPDPIVNLSSNSPICEGDLNISASLMPNSTPVASWEWLGPCNFSETGEEVTIPEFSADCAGEYFLTAITNLGCESSESIVISSIALTAPALIIDCPAEICPNSICKITGTAYPQTNAAYFWDVDEGVEILNAANTNILEFKAEQSGMFTVSYQVEADGCFTDWVSYEITVIDDPIINDDSYEVSFETTFSNMDVLQNDILGPDYTLSITQAPEHGTVIQNSEGTLDFIPANGYFGTDQFIYEICIQCAETSCAEGRVDILIPFDEECEIPTVLTPNGDNKNDRLVIHCLDNQQFSQNELSIYNQWGDRVFYASPYLNDWEGTNKGIADDPLPDGTYFFILRKSMATEIEKGSLTILR